MAGDARQVAPGALASAPSSGKSACVRACVVLSCLALLCFVRMHGVNVRCVAVSGTNGGLHRRMGCAAFAAMHCELYGCVACTADA